MNSNLAIRIISAAECMPLRSLVLRSGQSHDKCTFPEDDDKSTFHLGAVLILNPGTKIVSVGTLICKQLAQLPNYKNSYQLRGMATDPVARGLGAGSMLLQKAEMLLLEKRCELIWFNAREKAFPFYEKSGYVELDGVIAVSEFGPHKLMYKKLR